MVVRIHISQIVSRTACKSGHSVQFQWITFGRFPISGTSQRRFAFFGWQICVYFGEQQRKIFIIKHIGNTILIVYGKRFAPIALTREYGVTQTVIDLDAAYAFFFYILFGGGDGFLDCKSVEVEIGTFAVHHNAFLGIERLLGNIGTFYQRYYRQVKVMGKGVIAAVMCGHGHDCARTISGKYIVAYPNRYLLACKRIDGVCAGEYTADTLVHKSLALGTALGCGDVVCYCFALLGGGDLVYILTLGSKYHKCYTEYRIGTCGEYFKVYVISSVDCKVHFGTFATTYPVALCFFERIGPINGIKTFKQTFGISTYAQTPLVHYFLLYRISASKRYTFRYFVVGQYRSQFWTPIYHSVAQISYTIVHQHIGLLFCIHSLPFFCGECEHLRGGCRSVGIGTFFREAIHKFGNGLCLTSLSIKIAQEHTLKSPLSPFVIFGIAGAYFARPVVAKAYFVKLFAITCYIGLRSHLGMLPGLYGILLGRQSVGVISHRVKYVEAF